MSEFLECCGQSSACLPSFNLYFCSFSDISKIPYSWESIFLHFLQPVCVRVQLNVIDSSKLGVNLLSCQPCPTACPCASSAKCKRFLKAGNQSTFLSILSYSLSFCEFPSTCQESIFFLSAFPASCRSMCLAECRSFLNAFVNQVPVFLHSTCNSQSVTLFACLPFLQSTLVRLQLNV